MFPKNFRPIGKFNLIRLGKNNDGGYLVEKDSLKESNGLLSFGLGYDWSFENDFFKNNKNQIHVYDAFVKKSNIKKYSLSSIRDLFSIRNYSNKYFLRNLFNKFQLYFKYKNFFKNDIRHFSNSIGIGPNLVSFEEALNKFNKFPIFIKIDIEGSEYRILDSILKNQDKFCGLVIEFHSVDLHKNNIKTFIDKFNLNLVHIHGQNVGDKSFLDKSGNPTQIEMSFSHSKNIIENNPQVPHPLDQPGDFRYEEAKIYFEKWIML